MVIAYYRVSRARQAEGVGLLAQAATVEAYAAQHGLRVLAAYTDVETGRRDHLYNRPQFLAAIAHARRSGASLVIARLDRLSRSVLVTTQLLASGVDFIALDAPHADRTTILLMALMAEHESRMTSARTLDAMASLRALGVAVGNPVWHFSPEDRLRAAEGARRAHLRRAREAYADIAPIAVSLHDAGASSTAIARHLNALGHCTTRRGPWTIASVKRLLRREITHDRERHALVLSSFADVTASCSSSSSTALTSTSSAAGIGSAAAADVLEECIVAASTASTSASVVATRGVAVIYCRVSTRSQGRSGLSLEAQRRTIAAHVVEHGLDIVAEYVEIESARGERLERRPELVKALARTKLTGGTLLIARLDRLTRSVVVTSRLLESKVRFRACDVPWATPLTIGMLAVLAEHESRLISERMRTAIAAGKAAGRVRGHVSNFTPESRRQGIAASAASRVARSRELYAEVEPIAQRLRADGHSLKAIAGQLNELGHRTQRGTPWSDMSVMRMLRRMELLKP